MIKFTHKYDDIISVDNLLEAWREFLNGKKSRQDVQEFQRHLMSNVLLLHKELKEKTYKHSAYEVFNISDPKPRIIHKARVRDRLLHHAIYRVLYPSFDKTFASDSFSCRLGKGTQKALERFKTFIQKVSKNHTKTVWILKCDIRKFFASVDQTVLIEILKNYIPDKDIIWLLVGIIRSFSSGSVGVGLPLGNLTSQLLVNIYMNEFDQYVKHRLKIKYYIRYADDFIVFSQDKSELVYLTEEIRDFLSKRLHLQLHPDKLSIKTIASGVDYLGWVHFTNHCVIRTTTKRKMLKKLAQNPKREVTASYLGLLKYGNSKKLQKRVSNLVFPH